MASDLFDNHEEMPPGNHHFILADIAFYLSAARSVFAGSFTYQKEFQYGLRQVDREHVLRGKALEKVERLLQEELVSYLLDEPALGPFAHSYEELMEVAGRILKTEILEEKRKEQNYYLKARMVGDLESLKEDSEVLKELEEKVTALENAEKNATEAVRHMEKLKNEVKAAKIKVLLGGLESREKGGQVTTPAALVGTGDALYENGNYEDAIAAYGRAVNLDPSGVIAFINRGKAYLENGEYEKAIEDFEKALSLDPQNATLYVNRASALALKGDHASAVRDYDSALQLNPDLDDVYYNRGTALLRQGMDYRSADRDLSFFVERHPKDYRGYLNRGIVRSLLGEYEAALKDYERTVELAPSNAPAYFNRGNTYLNLGDIAHAVKDYTRSLDMEAGEENVFHNRGIAYVRMGEMEKALDDFSHAIECDPLDGEAYLRRGWIYAQLGKKSRSTGDWERARSLGIDAAQRYLEKYDRSG